MAAPKGGRTYAEVAETIQRIRDERAGLADNRSPTLEKLLTDGSQWYYYFGPWRNAPIRATWMAAPDTLTDGSGQIIPEDRAARWERESKLSKEVMVVGWCPLERGKPIAYTVYQPNYWLVVGVQQSHRERLQRAVMDQVLAQPLLGEVRDWKEITDGGV